MKEDGDMLGSVIDSIEYGGFRLYLYDIPADVCVPRNKINLKLVDSEGMRVDLEFMGAPYLNSNEPDYFVGINKTEGLSAISFCCLRYKINMEKGKLIYRETLK
ncbi:hypothetical protein [endosymbiont of Lamellibrachia barhami]|uniref:hypothetical protein n=1 Tax=endosymbiont of Lamellibrachia barhami TaxID=205975 RepID=UPI0015B15EA4|nr:hypothetical protein [endosymbiont of Lamellibrachia barhami]